MEDEAKFASIPWVRKLLQDPHWASIPTPSRIPKPSGEDSFFAKLLNTPTTMEGYLTQFRRPDWALANPAPLTKERIKQEAAEVMELRTFITLGKDLAGHPEITHGGVTASIFDEVMGVMIMIRLLGGDPHLAGDGNGLFTAFMNIQYKRPVPINSAIMVLAWVKKIEGGRKFWIESEIKNEQGEVCATGQTLYVRAKPKL